jgi:hypothetical protein
MSASAGVYHSLIIAQFGTRKYTQKQVKHFYFSKKKKGETPSCHVSCSSLFRQQRQDSSFVAMIPFGSRARCGAMAS